MSSISLIMWVEKIKNVSGVLQLSWCAYEVFELHVCIKNPTARTFRPVLIVTVCAVMLTLISDCVLPVFMFTYIATLLWLPIWHTLSSLIANYFPHLRIETFQQPKQGLAFSDIHMFSCGWKKKWKLKAFCFKMTPLVSWIHKSLFAWIHLVSDARVHLGFLLQNSKTLKKTSVPDQVTASGWWKCKMSQGQFEGW